MAYTGTAERNTAQNAIHSPAYMQKHKKDGKNFFNFLKKPDFTGKKWILCRENSGKNGPQRMQQPEGRTKNSRKNTAPELVNGKKLHQARHQMQQNEQPERMQQQGPERMQTERIHQQPQRMQQNAKKPRHSRTAPERAENIGI